MNACCENLENRAEGPGPRGYAGLGDAEHRADVSVTHCVVCEARHLEAEAEPGELGLLGAGL